VRRKIGDPNVLLAIATWDSKSVRDEMEAKQAAEVRRIIDEQAAFVEVRVVGEFEAPEWQVIPPRA